MNFLNLFSYLELAAGVLTIASAIQSMISSPAPISGPALSFAVQPFLAGLTALTHKQVPQDLVSELAQSVADVLNTYYKKNPPAGGVTGGLTGGVNTGTVFTSATK